ncbi:YjcG family protein [Gottfriedia acidiceleris]|uniref:Putative phosphoesterase MY490_16680 n=1 Tax=Gottfriedia acidiceleris TaxID=371036 RepID=A0ABY4JHU7_9BACI|nr:YjcG family protein [Gottfriedia acidiceleris]UPM53415.1 YjcG family protein [Gottfriedia acidiceleris]
MKCGVVIFPSNLVQDKANEYRKRFDPAYTLISPHVTVRSGFELSEDQLPNIISQLNEIASQIEPFELEINKVSSFAPVNNVIYLKVTPVEALKELHEKMHTGAFPEIKDYAFVPHITIGQQLQDAEFADILGQLRMIQFSYSEVVDNFKLVYQLENGAWEVYETFKLGAKK